MAVEDPPLLAALHARMNWLNHRQQVLAQNVANASTPGYQPRDLKPKTFEETLKSAQGDDFALARTHPAHFADSGSVTGSDKDQAAPDSETTLSGNEVVLEDEMIKMNDSSGDFAAAVSFYEQSLGLIQLAAKAPGK